MGFQPVAPASLPSGSVTAPAISFLYSRRTVGLYYPALNTLGIAAKGGDVARFLGVASGVNYITFTNSITGVAPAIAATGADTNMDLLIDAKGTGTVKLASVSTGGVTFGDDLFVTGIVTVTSASATALAVGRLGATTPALVVDASTATSITGIKIKSAAAGGGVAVSAVGEASNGALTIDAQGSGTITFGATSTGNIVLGRAATGVSLAVTAGFTALSGTAVPATAGAIAAGAPITMFSTGIKIWVTSDVPSHTATKGDICINTGGSSSSTRMYVNNGTTNWIAFSTAS